MITSDDRAHPRSKSRDRALLVAWAVTILLIPAAALTIYRGIGLGIYIAIALGIVLTSLAIGVARSGLRYTKAILTSTRNVAHRLKHVETVLDGTSQTITRSKSLNTASMSAMSTSSSSSAADQKASRSDTEAYGRHATPAPSGIDTGWDYLATMVDQVPHSNVAVLAGSKVIELNITTQAVGVLVPGIARSLVAQIRPRTVVIDRMALQNGPWCGVESAQRTVCTQELLRAAAEAKAAGAQIVYVDAPLPPDINTHVIKECADVVLPSSTLLEQSDGAPLSADLRALVELAGSRFAEKRDERHGTT